MSILHPTHLTPAPRLSVFVDAENISVTHAKAIIELARRHGTPDLIRAYGNACLLPEWDKMPGFQFIHSGSGKNATDMLICVDAMERALSDHCATVLLVSSDQDFTHLATRLRGYGLTVIGAGEAKTLERFRAACSRFHELACSKAQIPAEPAPRPQPALRVSAQVPADLDQKIRDVIRSNCRDNTGYEIASLSACMHKLHSVNISTTPDKNWRTYFANRSALYDLDPKGPNAKVRYKPEAFRVAAT